MDILRQARPQYKVIIHPESGKPLPVQQKTELEIGFGNGEFTVQYAEKNPEILFYGIEISQACVLRCARRAYGLSNLRLINTDARFMLRELFPDESLQKIIMQFPCPWSKNADAHKRVTAKDFSDGLATVLKVNGIFEMVSDDEPYANEVWKILGGHEALRAEDFEVNPSRMITTKYERKWLEEGRNIYRVTFRKTKAFTVTRRTSEEMHIKINRTVTAEDIESLRNIEGKSDKGSKSFWKFGRSFTDGNGKIYLLETLTSDDEFEQKFYIHVAPKDEGFLLRLDKTADAFLTPAVRSALNDAAARLS
ncbi:MAG: tRNA (guanosine(46)-N7)-methyltransferase TrmB [Synergistaceae bacterium]|nr:tRNA (guanosine(46)-N7)-methyltransferase TrmB [Synergistaceae bacterium]